MTSEWPDDVFTSAEIEEMNYRFADAMKDEPVHLDLFFQLDKAREYIEAVRAAPYHPVAAQHVLAFNQYLAEVVRMKLRERG